MCELLGMSANVPTDICFSFAGLMERGGRTGAHKDGWGISFYEQNGCRTFHDPECCADSVLAQLIKNYPIKSHIVLSHIRKANRGKITLENTHPFCRELWGRHWSFAHNGQLKGIKKRPLSRFLPIGTTDSEHAFCWILEQIIKKYPTPPTARVQLKKFIQSLCDDIASLGVFNMLLSDSKHLYAYCSTKLYWISRRAPFTTAQLLDTDLSVDFGEHTTPKDIVSVIATEPLTKNEQWTQLKRGELLCLRHGNPI